MRRTRDRCGSPGRTLCLIAGLLVGITRPSAATPPAGPAAADRPCPLCREDPGVPVVHLSASLIESVVSQHAEFNEMQIARIDSVLRSGRWGPPDSREARERAHLTARLTLVTAYRDLVLLASAEDRVYEVAGADLARLCERYSDASLFLPPRMIRVRIGRGRVCVRYALDEPGRGEGWHGGRPLRWEVRDAQLDGRTRRVLDVALPSGQDGEVNLLLAEHHTMAVSHEICPGPSVRYEWTRVHGIEGVWIRKWGTHRPTAYTRWRSVAAETVARGACPGAQAAAVLAGSVSPVAPLPATPVMGIRIYVPGLKLRLPLLPDINVEDLREVELITPLLDVEYLRRGGYPDWLVRNRHLGFEGWRGHGPLPPAVREAFPDR